MKDFIERLRSLAKSIPNNTKENRARKGTYVHAIEIAKEYSDTVTTQKCKCGNSLTEKELFYETCLQCNDVVISED